MKGIEIMARPSSWTKEDEQLLVDNFPYMSNLDLRNQFFPNRPIRGIESKARKMKLYKISDAWTKEEEDVLREYYGVKPIAELMEFLPNRTYSAIWSHANLIGLKTRYLWTESEIKILIDNYVAIGPEACEKLLPNHPYGSITDKAHELGLFRRPNPEDWTDEEIRLLKEYYNIYSAKELIKKFFPNRKIGQIEKKKRELGLNVTSRFKNGELYWTEERLRLLYDIYPHMNSEEFHDTYFPDLSLSGMYAMCNRLGIKKTKEFSSGWTEDEIEICRALYLDKTVLIDDICKACNKGPKQIEYMANKVLKLTRRAEFSDDEIEILKEKYPHMSTEDLVPVLENKTASQIDRFAHNELKLFKTKDYIRMATLDGTKNSLQPSSVQTTINNLLDDMKITFEEEYDIKYYLVDCYLTDYHLMIEVQGDFWHCSPLLNKNSVGIKNNVVKDKRKHTYIKNKYGIEVLYLWESDVRNNIDLCQKLIETYISSNGKLDNYHSFNYQMDEDGHLILINNIYKMPY